MKKPHKIRRARLLRELPTDKLPTDVETLQTELRKARLYNQALQEAILIAEQELGTPILKSLVPSNPESGAKNALPSSWSALPLVWLQ